MWNDPIQLARAWHWDDAAPVDIVHADDPDLPDELVACGRFVCLHVLLPGESAARILGCDDKDCFLAFDPESADGRLYIVLSDAAEEAAAAWFDPRNVVELDELARHAGGRQQGGYPDVEVTPFGVIHQVEYYTKKNGQGAQKGAVFFHSHDRRPRAWLGVDASGRLWYAGGDYVASDTRGIVG